MASGHDRRLLQTRNQHEDTLPAPFLALLLFGSWSHRGEAANAVYMKYITWVQL